MNMKTLLILLLLGFGLGSCANAQKQEDKSQTNDSTLLVENVGIGERKSDNAVSPEQQDPAFSAVQQFYEKYITEISKDATDNKKIEAIRKQYVNQRFLDKLQNMYQDMELDYDPFLAAQDCDKSVLDSLRIEQDTVRTGIYNVYLWNNFNKKYDKVTLLMKQDGQAYKIDDVLSL